ncbi:Cyanovirin-N [Xylaria sp. FL1042]|nr:Cyanovirin-N [Xylaria sp. FL1042]
MCTSYPSHPRQSTHPGSSRTRRPNTHQTQTAFDNFFALLTPRIFIFRLLLENKMQFLASFLLSALLLLSLASAGWREECDFGGNAQYNLMQGTPYLSTYCPDHTGRQICTMLDLNSCLMNSLGHLTGTINGQFHRTCANCRLTGRNATVLSCSCRMFGKNAAWHTTEVDLEEVVENRDGHLACWDSAPMNCPGFV